MHAGRWHRQISLLAMESIEKIRANALKARPGAFAENITTQSADIPSLSVGDRIRITGTELEVTQIGKEYHARCAIYYKAGDCVMPREGVFAKVVRGGTIHVDDIFEVIPGQKALGHPTVGKETPGEPEVFSLPHLSEED